MSRKIRHLPIKKVLVAMPKTPTQSSEISNNFTGSEFNSFFNSGMSASHPVVTENSLLSLTAVYACTTLIAGALTSMPLTVYKNKNGISEKAEDHPLWWLFNESPHPTWAASAFWSHMMLSRLFYGDAFARIIRPSKLSASIQYIEPLHPHQVSVTKDDSGILIYKIKTGDTHTTVDQSDMLHITNLGFNGLRSPSPLQYSLKNVGTTTLMIEQYAQTYFKNNATPSVAITLKDGSTFSPEALQQFVTGWEQKHSNPINAHRPTILQDGMKIEQLAITAEDAQLLTTRKFQLEEICHIFGVPPFLIGSTTGTSNWGPGVEQMGIGFIKYTMQRHLRAFEQEFNRKIWPKSTSLFVQFDTSGLERGDHKTRNESYRIALGRAGEPGWMTVNEIRKKENLPPVYNGDTLTTAMPTQQA